MNRWLRSGTALAFAAWSTGCGDAKKAALPGEEPSSDDTSASSASGAATSSAGGPGGGGPGGASGQGGAQASGGGPSGAGGAGGAQASSSSSGAGGGPQGVDPSLGMGGLIAPGQTGATPLGAVIRIPAGYDPAAFASPVVWLFNEELSSWSTIADSDDVVLVDLDEYNDINAIVDKLNDSQTVLESEYNVDKARYYWAGWSAGGNIAIIIAAQNQDVVAGTLVFPGTGGNLAQPYMAGNQGHKIRLFYACGDQDPNYPWSAVKNEADVWAAYGYTTQFEQAAGSGHYIDEAVYGVRAHGWSWIKGYNLAN